jgi:hypothetical protein
MEEMSIQSELPAEALIPLLTRGFLSSLHIHNKNSRRDSDTKQRIARKTKLSGFLGGFLLN